MKRAVILLNMGGARDKNELREFLKNMFLDKRIVHSPLRFVLSPLITALRTNKSWKNYELIGGSNIYKYTQSLVDKIKTISDSQYDIFFAMRYTSPKIEDVMLDKDYDELLLFPMYPHFSSTTTLSSFDSADGLFKDKSIKIHKIEHFFDDCIFNESIIKTIKNHYDKDAYLIFSAHSLPVHIANSDLYLKHIKSHVDILSKMLLDSGLKFKGICLAFQSKLGPIKWLEPSIGKVLTTIAPNPVVVYPISFVIDNSETDYELTLYYKDVAKKLGINLYNVCKTQNDSEAFARFIDTKAREEFKMEKAGK